DGSFLTRLNPAVFVYKASEQPDHKVAIHHGLLEDLYVIYAGGNPERPTIKAFVNPLVSFVWLGVFILVFGTSLALVPKAVKATVPTTAVTVAAGGERGSWEPGGGRKRSAVWRGASFLCCAVVLLMGADTKEARFQRLGGKIMCSCGCAEMLLQCNHVGCPNSDRMIRELHALTGTTGGVPGAGDSSKIASLKPIDDDEK